MLTKKSQTAWRKPKTKKRMGKDELQRYRAWLFLTHPICQICNVNPASEAHHAVYGRFGADKDDRTLVAACRECHYNIHHGGGVPMSREAIEGIGWANWAEYCG